MSRSEINDLTSWSGVVPVIDGTSGVKCSSGNTCMRLPVGSLLIHELKVRSAVSLIHVFVNGHCCGWHPDLGGRP